MGCTNPTSRHGSSPPQPALYQSTNKKILHEDNLSCGVCALEYDLNERLPIMICINQHNVCKACVDLFRGTVAPTCPYCRNLLDFSTMNGNRILIEILEHKIKKKAKLQSQQCTPKDKLLKEAREVNLQRIIFLIESGADHNAVTDIHLWQAKMTRIIDLSYFPNVKTLDLHKNQIKQISNLQALVHLNYLNLGKNHIATIEGLETLKKLQFLDLCHNRITKIENLSDLTSLFTLNLSDNYLTTVQNLSSLKKLGILYLSNNLINPETNVGALKALEHQGVSYELDKHTPCK